VALDAGHSALSPGATSARGEPERAFNLALRTVLGATLKAKGIGNVLLVVGSVDLRSRAEQANKFGADVFISIHHDSVQARYLDRWTVEGKELTFSDRFSGFSLFVSGKNRLAAQSVELAGHVGRALTAANLHPSLHHAEKIPGEGRILLNEKLGIYRYDGLVVLNVSRMPAILIEAGILKNRSDELQLRSKSFRQVVSAAIANAILDYCSSEQRALTTRYTPPSR
jgi:N-acetylmuramoyl-L-alanine amidase